MCKKERTYNKVRIEVCRNCHGVGLIRTEGNNYGNQGLQQCPICRGSGRVKKTMNVNITIEPCAGDFRTVK